MCLIAQPCRRCLNQIRLYRREFPAHALTARYHPLGSRDPLEVIDRHDTVADSRPIPVPQQPAHVRRGFRPNGVVILKPVQYPVAETLSRDFQRVHLAAQDKAFYPTGSASNTFCIASNKLLPYILAGEIDRVEIDICA